MPNLTKRSALLQKPRAPRLTKVPGQKPARAPHNLMTIPRDHIIPFRSNVFVLTHRGEPEDHVTVLDPDRRPDIGDKVVILWADKARRPEFGYFAAMEYRRNV